MIRPWYRSRLFWFGIPVLRFCLLGGSRFRSAGAGVGWSSGERMLSVEDSSGEDPFHDGMATPSGWTSRWLSRGDGIEEAHTKRFPAVIGWTGWEGGTLFRSASFHVSWHLIVTYLRNKGKTAVWEAQHGTATQLMLCLPVIQMIPSA